MNIIDFNTQETVKGLYTGFAGFDFKDNEISWLPCLVDVETGEQFALPSHYVIMRIFAANIDRLRENETVVEVKRLGGIEFENGRVMFQYEVKFDGVVMKEQPVITAEQLRAQGARLLR